jgi:hypothetical protein
MSTLSRPPQSIDSDREKTTLCNTTVRNRSVLRFVCLLTLLISACGSIQHAAKLEPRYSPPSEAEIQLGEIKNGTGSVYDVDVETMLSDALTETLQEREMLTSGADGDTLVLNAEIVAYKKGDAFQRWLWFGLGQTLLDVHCELQ